MADKSSIRIEFLVRRNARIAFRFSTISDENVPRLTNARRISIADRRAGGVQSPAAERGCRKARGAEPTHREASTEQSEQYLAVDDAARTHHNTAHSSSPLRHCSSIVARANALFHRRKHGGIISLRKSRRERARMQNGDGGNGKFVSGRPLDGEIVLRPRIGDRDTTNWNETDFSLLRPDWLNSNLQLNNLLSRASRLIAYAISRHCSSPAFRFSCILCIRNEMLPYSHQFISGSE